MSALECCRQAGSDRSPAAWTSIRPTWSPSSTLLSRPPPGPRRRRRRGRTGEPTPSPCRPRSPPPWARSPPASSPTPLEWQLPRTTAAISAAQDNPAPAARWRCAASRPEPGPSHPAWTSSPRRSAAPCAISSAPPSSTTTRPASCLRGKTAPTPICGHSPAGPPPKPSSRKPACPTASTARTKSTSAMTSKIQPPLQRRRPRRPRARRAPSAGPGQNISGPRCRGQAGYPRVSTRAGPVATLRPGPGRVPGRAGFGPPSRGRRGPEAHIGPARAGPRVGRGQISHGCPAGAAAGHH